MIDWAAFGVSAPDANAAFGELTDAQKAAVLNTLGYKKHYVMVYTDGTGKKFITRNGNPTEQAYTPDWLQRDGSGNDHYTTEIVNIQVEGLQDKWITIPTGAEGDIAKVVSQGKPILENVIVGQYYDETDLEYYQDSAHKHRTSSRVNISGNDYVTFNSNADAGRRFKAQNISDQNRVYEILHDSIAVGQDASAVSNSNKDITTFDYDRLWSAATQFTTGSSYTGNSTDIRGIPIYGVSQNFFGKARVLELVGDTIHTRELDVGDLEVYQHKITVDFGDWYSKVDNEGSDDEDYIVVRVQVNGSTKWNDWSFDNDYDASSVGSYTTSWLDYFSSNTTSTRIELWENDGDKRHSVIGHNSTGDNKSGDDDYIDYWNHYNRSLTSGNGTKSFDGSRSHAKIIYKDLTMVQFTHISHSLGILSLRLTRV